MRRLMAALLALCLMGQAMAEPTDEMTEILALMCPGAYLDGRTLVMPEGVTQLGEKWHYGPMWCYGEDTPAFDEESEVDWDDDWENDDTIFLEGSYLVDDDWEPVFDELRLPSTLRCIGTEGLVYLRVKGDLVIPEGVEEIMMDGLYACTVEGRLVLPSTLRSFSFLNGCTFGEVAVSPDNPRYCSVDGVVYSKDMTRLVWYPDTLRATHFDVPAGVRIVGRSAFSGNDHLQTISLPIGLQKIGESAFLGCGRLQAVTVPLTVTEVGDMAFADCVSLQRASILPGLVKEKTFDNCPALDRFEGDNGGTVEGDFTPEDYVVASMQPRMVLANSVNGKDEVPLFGAIAGRQVRSVPSGTPLRVILPEVTWQMLLDGEGLSPEWLVLIGLGSYSAEKVRAADVVPVPDALFRYAETTYAGTGKLTVYAEMNTNAEKTKLTAGEARAMRYEPETTPWVRVIDTDADWKTLGWCFLGDLTMTREAEDDGLILGVVIASQISDRVHLREKPDKGSQSLGKYFTGTQLKIIGEKGNFWHVEIEDQTGWMMKDYVRVVREREK